MVPNLNDKKNYVIHIKALNQALKHGLILEKVHRVIELNQSAWLKPYIDFNTQLRTQAKNDFEKDFFKLMNNSLFGKTMENIRKHKDIKLIINRESYLKTVMKPYPIASSSKVDPITFKATPLTFTQPHWNPIHFTETPSNGPQPHWILLKTPSEKLGKLIPPRDTGDNLLLKI